MLLTAGHVNSIVLFTIFKILMTTRINYIAACVKGLNDQNILSASDSILF